MSERKSWDVQIKRRAEVPAPAPAPVRRVEVKAAPARRTSAPKRPIAPPSGTLKQRRKQKRRSFQYVVLALLALLIAGIFFVLWRPALRVTEVNAGGPGAETAKQVVGREISGTYAYIIPRNSVFFLPEERIRASLIETIPEASAVSLRRTSFSSLYVETTGRAELFIWCGTSIDSPVPDGSCYEADIHGFIFRKAADISSTTPQAPREQVRVFGALNREASGDESPIGAQLAFTGSMTDALKFVDAIRELGAPVSALAIRGDEADLWLGRPARITYVLGKEKDAAFLAASALPAINLTDATIEYIDLRFPGKAYIKRYGQ